MSGVEHADDVFAAAAARHPGILVPGGATSPMDSSTTLNLSADLIAECEPGHGTDVIDPGMRQAAAGIRARPSLVKRPA